MGRYHGSVVVPGGRFATFRADPVAIADVMRDRSWVPTYQRRSLQWAAEHSWDALGPMWRDLLA
jgi:hypothetical protein